MPAAAKTTTLTFGWTDGQEVMADGNASASYQATAELDEDIPSGATDLALDIAFPFAAVKSVYIIADQDLTVETNTTSGTDDLVLKANVPLLFVSGKFGANPFTANVTKFYVTNASGAAAILRVRVGYDPTP